MAIRCITVKLADEQLARLKPMLAAVRKADQRGKPGMLLAQLIGGDLKVFFATSDQAMKIQAAMGSPVGLTTGDRRISDAIN